MIRTNNLNQFPETLISMEFDAECNETTPAISFDRFHEDFEIITEINQILFKKTSGQVSDVNPQKIEAQIWNQRPLLSRRLR